MLRLEVEERDTLLGDVMGAAERVRAGGDGVCECAPWPDGAGIHEVAECSRTDPL